LIILIILGEEYKLWSSLCSFLQPHVTSCLFGQKLQITYKIHALHVLSSEGKNTIYDY
jgi:hypothetical protein